VLRAVEVIRTLDRAPTRRPVPREAPMALVTDAWRPYIREPDGRIGRRYYELCTLWSLRSALRAGNIWVAHSRRYAKPDTYSGFQISVWQSRNRQRSPWLCLALTPPSPGGGFASKVKTESKIVRF
jgi:hypothetical protein